QNSQLLQRFLRIREFETWRPLDESRVNKMSNPSAALMERLYNLRRFFIAERSWLCQPSRPAGLDQTLCRNPDRTTPPPVDTRQVFPTDSSGWGCRPASQSRKRALAPGPMP